MYCISFRLYQLSGQCVHLSKQTSKVIKIVARKRIDKRGESLTVAIRDILREVYPDKYISMGGLFLVRQGKIYIHVMPNDFSKTPCDTAEKADEWLHFFEASAPIVGLTTLHSKDPGFNLRDEHTHCIGKGEGGHYHHDTTPDTIEYEAYLNVAQKIVRVDQPFHGNELLKVKSQSAH
ncbi:ester hydrolase C11orf54 homolog [Panonychus citri]|uniref:ester hydrolase C11orf54 homolog n=1 Tax=Panonychus citri TaxID=50023 RepID=UPI002307A971|nr:ester hydrolase C11orf54 homolog [Panonychus citri]